MERIIGGRFGNKGEADRAAATLHAYVADDDISIFHNNAPGQHAQYPIGGDEQADPEAEHAHGTAAATAAVAGVVAGAAAVAAGPVAALAAAGVAAYTGSLVGALGGADGDTDSGIVPQRRPAGIILAVRLADRADEARVITDLKNAGALAVEVADGEWRDGDWADFDPLAAPTLVHSRPAA